MRKITALFVVLFATASVTSTELLAKSEATGFQVMKEKFIEGGWDFMSLVLVCLIVGLAFSIERIITLNLASVNTNKLMAKIDEKLSNKDIDGAMEVCKSTSGPAANVIYEGLRVSSHGVETVEKAIVNYGSVQMGSLEKGMLWISLTIAVAPMLGFLGTVIGMIQAFDKIAEMGDMDIGTVADGIKVALLTTVFGLVAAIILQIFYNYLLTKIDGIVGSMEESTIALVDILEKYNIIK